MIPQISPYGGALVDLVAAPEARADLKAHASRLPSLQLSARAACDLELLATGGFSPLTQFMGAADYARVLAEMRLADGTLFPIPITLPTEPDDALLLDAQIALRDRRNIRLALLTLV